ncbi:aminomethyl-transferring glycine dehydrogenase subunit GcvPB [Caldiplasma sukawensis]
MSYHQATYDEKNLNEYNSGNTFYAPDLEDLNIKIDEELKRENLKLPDISENDVVRHYVRLSQMNFGVDTGFYPLGSCTMKYNPKYADELSRDSGLVGFHPLSHWNSTQGNLMILYELKQLLMKISGMDDVSLQPMAGAQGEYTALLVARKYLEDTGKMNRKEVIVPDSAHGTNPASAAMAGFDVTEIESNEDGTVNLDALKYALSDRTAVFMITNPNTIGIFEKSIDKISEMVHKAGALLYYDGANFNAILGVTNPGKMGFDMVHFNLHKTFATPHGGGGPGSGPIAVRSFLSPYLPSPRIEKENEKYIVRENYPKSIGRVSGFYGTFVNLMRAWAYIKVKGENGLLDNTLRAVVNSNYLAKLLEKDLEIKNGLKKHEFVASTKNTGRKALNIAKYLIDHGVHSPTIYFPLIIKEAMMIEPTEDASKEDLDQFADLIKSAINTPEEELEKLPVNLSIKRADDVRASKQLKVHW